MNRRFGFSATNDLAQSLAACTHRVLPAANRGGPPWGAWFATQFSGQDGGPLLIPHAEERYDPLHQPPSS